MKYRMKISATIRFIALILPVLLVFIGGVKAQPVCAELELSTVQFVPGMPMAPVSAVPMQSVAGQPLVMFARRTEPGPGCAPLPGAPALVLSATLNFDVPAAGQQLFTVTDIDGIDARAAGVAIPINVNSVNGISQQAFQLNYGDAGRVSITVTDTSGPAISTSRLISWRPASFMLNQIFLPGNPAAVTAQAGAVPAINVTPLFTQAGAAFSVLATALNANGLPMPNFGLNVPGGPPGDGEQLILRSNLLAPAGGRNGRQPGNPLNGGTLVNGTDWQPVLVAGSRTGQLRGDNFAFNEVGIVQLSVGLAPQQNEAVQGSIALNNPLPAVAQYFSGGADVLPIALAGVANGSGNIRFVPASFGAPDGLLPNDIQANLPQFNTGCPLAVADVDANGTLQGGYTYAGDWLTYAPGQQPTILLTPQATDGLPLTNYTGNFMRITPQSLNGRLYAAAVGVLANFGLTVDPGTPNVPADDTAQDMNIQGNPDGTVIIQAMLTQNAGPGANRRLLGFVRAPAAPVAPFDADISLTVPVVDADGVTTTNNLPVVFGAATPGNGITFTGDDMTPAAAFTGRQIRHGQLTLGNGAGATTPNELAPTTFVQLPLSVEYFTGRGFVPHTWDNCTQIVRAAVQVAQANGQGGNINFLPQNRFADPNLDGRANLLTAAIINGDALLLYFSGLAGILQVTYNFGAVPAPSPLHLVPLGANVRGQVSFGLYQGDIRIVHRTYHSRGVN